MLFAVYLREAWKNITKKPLLSTLTILFLTFTVLFFCVFARISTIKTITEDNLQKSEAYIQYKQYSFNTDTKGVGVGSYNSTDDKFTYLYPPDEDEVEIRTEALGYFDELSDFFDTIFTLDSEDIKVVYMSGEWTTLIVNSKGAKNLEETYNKNFRKEDISEYKKQGIDTTFLETGAYVKTIFVSQSFFDHEKLNFAKGGVPTEEDLNYKFISDEETPVIEIPVIVGSAFAEDYEVGDIIERAYEPYESPETDWQRYSSDYHQQMFCKYRIVGILSEDNAITNCYGSSISNLSKNIIVPYHFLTDPAFTEKYTDNQKIVRVDDLFWEITQVKLYINREKEAECVSILWDMIDNSSLKDYLKPHTFDVLNEISITIANARDTSYKVLAIAIAVFCSIGVFIMILNNQKDNIRDYSVHMISGASKADILLTGVVETLIYVLIADILMQYPRIYMMFGWQQNSPLGTWMGMWSGMIPIVIAENLIIILIAFICNYISVSKISFSEVLKRKD